MNFKTTILCFISTLYFLTLNAQINEHFSFDIGGRLSFQTVTSTGTWLVCTDKSLASYNQDDGKLLWQNTSLGGIQESQVSEISGSPLLMIKLNNDVQFIDPFSGDLRFSSSQQGLTELNYERMLFRSNGLLIAGNKGANSPILMMVDLSSGSVRWALEEKFGKIISATEFTKDEMLLVTLFNVYRLSSSNGTTIWKESTSETSEGMANSGALGGALAAFTEQLAANVNFNIRYYEYKEKDVFLIGSEVENKRTTSDGKTSISYSNNYTAFKLSTGKRLWNNPVDMKGKFGVVVFQGNDAIILPDDGNKTVINAFDVNSGEGKWGKKGKGISMKGGVYDSFVTDKGILLVSGSGSNTFLNFLNAGTGVLNYEKSVKVSGRVVKLLPSMGNFAFVTTEEMNIIDPLTGELKLSKSISTIPSLTVMDGNKMVIADPKKGTIKKINFDNNEVEEFFAEGIKFGGKESPQQIELRSDGYLLTAEQNIALIGKSGELKFNKHYDAPRESGLKRALLYAQAARAAYISANAYYAAGTLQSAAPQVAEQDAVGGALVEGFGEIYQNLGEQAEAFAKKSIEQARSRAKATTQARDFMVILSDNGKEFVLLKVNKNSGEIDGEISLGKDKEPKYAVDDVTGRVFRLTPGNKIAGYKL
jgi:outer membrane protein assembly factor BamB